jgi:hypothetical protein
MNLDTIRAALESIQKIGWAETDDEIAAIQAMIDAIIDGRVQIIAKVP